MIKEDGIFFEPQNIDSIVEVLSELATKSKLEIEVMKKKSIEICEKQYSASIIANKFNKIFEIVVANN
jgi:glycosyltransferase involved in cell wall biosynthesis